jgi:hypothetical protein
MEAGAGVAARMAGGCCAHGSGVGAGRGGGCAHGRVPVAAGVAAGAGARVRQSDGFGWRRGWQSDDRDGGGGMVVLVYTIALRISRYYRESHNIRALVSSGLPRQVDPHMHLSADAKNIL